MCLLSPTNISPAVELLILLFLRWKPRWESVICSL